MTGSLSLCKDTLRQLLAGQVRHRNEPVGVRIISQITVQEWTYHSKSPSLLLSGKLETPLPQAWPERYRVRPSLHNHQGRCFGRPQLAKGGSGSNKHNLLRCLHDAVRAEPPNSAQLHPVKCVEQLTQGLSASKCEDHLGHTTVYRALVLRFSGHCSTTSAGQGR